MQSPRPRTVQSIFQVSLEIYRRNFLQFMGLAACFLLPFAIVSVYVRTHFTTLTNDQLQQILSEIQKQGHSSSQAMFNILPIGMEIWFAVICFVYAILVCPLLYGAIAHAVMRVAQASTKFSFAESGSASFSRVWQNIGTALLTGITYFVLCLAYTLLLGFISGLFGYISSALAVIFGILGTLFFIVAVIWFLVKISFVPIIVTLEGKILFRAIRESMRMTRHQMARLVGFYFMLMISMFIVDTILSLILDVLFHSPGAQMLVGVITSMLLVPLMFVCMSVMYFDVQMRQID